MKKSENIKLKIASRLAIARKNAGLSQNQAAKIIGLHRPTISEIEAGRRAVTADEMVRFSEIYSVDINWLSGKDKKKYNPINDEIELAARELSKLKNKDLDKVINLLKTLRGSEKK